MGKPGPNDWKGSWDIFIRELIAETGGSPDENRDKAKARFANMIVTWEGTVEEEFPADGSANGIKMQANPNTPGLKVKVGNYTGDGVVVLHLKPAAAQVSEWTKLAPGTKVRFKAKISESVYLVMGPTVNIMINSAEILK